MYPICFLNINTLLVSQLCWLAAEEWRLTSITLALSGVGTKQNPGPQGVRQLPKTEKGQLINAIRRWGKHVIFFLASSMRRRACPPRVAVPAGQRLSGPANRSLACGLLFAASGATTSTLTDGIIMASLKQH